MKRMNGTLGSCVRQATAVFGSRTREKPTPAAPDVRCQVQGKLVTGLFLFPGETRGITLERLGEAITTQARINPSPLEQHPATLEYDETGIGHLVNDRRVVGVLSLEDETEPVALFYCAEREAAEPKQQ